jgi:Cu-Zn family superoxide dismutase
MTQVKTLCLVAMITTGLLCAGCEKDRSGSAPTTQPGTAADKTAKANIRSAQAHTTPVTGTVEFHEQADGVRVVADVKGLTPGMHGFHGHEKGDLSDPKLISAGPHFNPAGHKHGGPDSEMRHAGDLGNLEADAQGNAKLDKVFKGITIKGATDGIVGRSVLIHAKADDLTTDPSGESGDRIAGGVIEAAAK